MKTDKSISLISNIRENVNKILVIELEKFGIVGIVPSHGNLIMYLYKNNSATKTELSENIGKGKSTVTKLLAKLIKLGYVEIKGNVEDKRSDLVYLTEKGKLLVPIILEISEKLFEEAYKDFSENDRKNFLELLTKFKNNLSKY